MHLKDLVRRKKKKGICTVASQESKFKMKVRVKEKKKERKSEDYFCSVTHKSVEFGFEIAKIPQDNDMISACSAEDPFTEGIESNGIHFCVVCFNRLHRIWLTDIPPENQFMKKKFKSFCNCERQP
jgi:hypothetical protein